MIFPTAAEESRPSGRRLLVVLHGVLRCLHGNQYCGKHPGNEMIKLNTLIRHIGVDFFVMNKRNVWQ